ncbi:MAG: hypothetical protein ABSH48_16805 [Verrucomicrobiota bacterium]|jgi:hypothetical protein
MKKILLLVVVVAIVGAVVMMRRPEAKPTVPLEAKPTVAAAEPLATNEVRTNNMGFFPLEKVKTQWKYFTDAEKAEFQSNFVARYKPAFNKWCDAFPGRVPISPDEVTPDKFVERIGPTARYHDYIFVVNGITLGIEDKAGVGARVDYLNAPSQTRQLAMMPTGGQAPISTSPITRDEVIQMLNADGGEQYKPQDIRITPTGYSGALNGGAYISVGGNPDNEASWDYDMVLGNDGKLAYFLRPRPR